MKQFLHLLLIFTLSTISLQAQNISVASFRVLENDLDARVNYPKRDQNGELCALIKVVSTQTGFSFDVGSLGVVAAEQKTGEIWVYIPRGVQRITIAHQHLGVLRNYAFDIPISSAVVYELVLTTAQVEVLVKERRIETQWVVINSQPEDADVYIDDLLQGKTPFQKEFEVGQHSYRVEQPLYHPEVGRITVRADRKESLSLTLRPNFGYIRISTLPEEGATVLVNGVPLSESTPVTTDRLKSGVYTLEVSKPLFHSSSRQVTVSDNRTEQVSFNLQPTFGGVHVSSGPEAGAEILHNGSPTGKTTPATLERLPKGEHTITVRKEWFEPTSRRITVSEGEHQQVEMAMQPTFGTVSISAQDKASIYVSGELKGNAQWEGRLTAGLYTIEARKEKYHTDSKQLQVQLGEKHNVSLHPQPMQGELKVLSSPFDAEISLNGQVVGSTPITLRNLLVGDYNLVLSKAGYGIVSKSITISEGQTTELNESLPVGREVTITSSPAGAQLWIDDQLVGYTPHTTTLSFGNHSLKLLNGKKELKESITLSQTGPTSWEFNMLEFVNHTQEVAGITINMVAVQGGTYTMGCTAEQGSDCDSDEKPAHQVSLSDFYIGKYPVTQAQWRAVMGTNPSYFQDCEQCPVEMVSWNDVQEFIKKLNRLTGKNYRLPTEAEWEYAARGGKQSRGFRYAGSNSIVDVAWYDRNSGSKTHPVGQKQANELGIYDMSGNVWEWCSDWYGSYSSETQTNPQGPDSGSSRVLRGGSWYSSERYCRVSRRIGNIPDSRYYGFGFRVVLVP